MQRPGLLEPPGVGSNITEEREAEALLNVSKCFVKGFNLPVRIITAFKQRAHHRVRAATSMVHTRKGWNCSESSGTPFTPCGSASAEANQAGLPNFLTQAHTYLL